MHEGAQDNRDSDSHSHSDSDSRPSSGTRPKKRARTHTDDATVAAQADGQRRRSQPAQRLRVRAAIACSVCRARKTKCDGRQPICGYCERTNSVCRFDGIETLVPQSSSCQTLGPQILGAIEDLTRLVHQQSYRALADQDDSQHQFSPDSTFSHAEHAVNPATESARLVGGLDALLKWKIFPPIIDAIPLDDGTAFPMSGDLPDLNFAELTRLKEIYIQVVHTFNPMLNLTTLDRYIAHVAENGFDWTTRTCLVAIVCAIGSLCQSPKPNAASPAGGAQYESDIGPAYRYWSVATKRLGRAMSQNDLESTQCLCLAGIWFMCNLRPIDAWKHFTIAGNCWYSAVLARNSTVGHELQAENSIQQTIEQSTFYTSYKSELEIRYELAARGSILELFEDQIVFPSPPLRVDRYVEESMPENQTKSWYYYLSDIAARHLINRIIRSRSRDKVQLQTAEVQRLLHEFEIFESQLAAWYRSLPPAISFEIPIAALPGVTNSYEDILWFRYLFIHELLCRPFVELCLNHSLNISEDLLDRVASIASSGLQDCAWRLQFATTITKPDHGIWTGIRSSSTCAMILIGAARSKQFPSLNGAARLKIPDNWREHAVGWMEKLGVYGKETRGGLKACVDLVRWGLLDFAMET